MALTIPDYANATFPEQAAPDSVDFDAIVAGFNLTGVVTGSLLVSQRAAGANLSVDVATGSAYSVGTLSSLGSVSNAAITPDATNPRWALVSFGGGTVTVTHGTAAASPVFPAIPGGKTLLAAVWVPAAAASITNANITDKRVILGATPGTTVQTESGLDAGQVGTSNAWAHEDHRHPITGLMDLATTQNIAGQKSFTGAHVLTAGLQAATAYGTLASTSAETLQNINAATSTNKVQLPGQFTQFGQYWDGALTQFWSTSIGSTVDNAAGATRMVLTAGTTALTGALEVGNKIVKSGSLAIPATINLATVLGQFSSANGALALRLHMHLVAGGIQRTKTYEFVVDKTTDATGTYYKLLPADQSSAQATANDFFVVAVRPATATSTWQFWVCTPATMAASGVLTWLVESYGDTVVTYASTLNPATSAPTLPFTGGIHPSNALDTVAGQVNIGFDTTMGAALNVLGNGAAVFAGQAGSTGQRGLMTLARSDGVNPVALSTSGASGDEFTDSVAGDFNIRIPGGINTVRFGSTSSGASTLRVTGTDVQILDGSIARSVPRGYITSNTANTVFGTTSASTTLVYGYLSTSTITVPTGGRRYRISVLIFAQSTVASDQAMWFINDGGAAAPTTAVQGTILQRSGHVHGTGLTGHSFFWEGTLTAGSHTFGIGFAREAGTGTLTVGSSTTGRPSRILVEDIGA